MNTRELLRRALMQRGLEQGVQRGHAARLAEELGVSRQTITGWTTGSLRIHPRWYIRLAHALDLPTKAFIEAAGMEETVAGLDELEVLHRWSLLYPGSVDEPLPARVEEDTQPAEDAFDDIEIAASGVDLEKLRQADPETYEELMRLAREALDRVNQRDA